MEGLPDKVALQAFRELSLGGPGLKLIRFLYEDGGDKSVVEVTWRNEQTRSAITYRFRGVVLRNGWPVSTNTLTVENVGVRQWETPRPLQISFNQDEVAFFASSIEQVE